MREATITTYHNCDIKITKSGNKKKGYDWYIYVTNPNNKKTKISFNGVDSTDCKRED